MTTIVAVRQNKKVHFAADSQATEGCTPYTVNKVYRVGKYTFAAAGMLANAQQTALRLKKDSKKKSPSFKRFLKAVGDDSGCSYALAVNKRLYAIDHSCSVVEMADCETL